ncbi:MAG: class I SAM-dependent methyltransferase [Thermoanaerobaculia bacterium]
MPEQDPGNEAAEYRYSECGPGWAHEYLWSPLRQLLSRNRPPPARIFEIGCGNGASAHMLSTLGYEVAGIDASVSGIRVANRAYPDLRLEVASAYDDLAARYGTYDAVLSLEVIEHLYAPRSFVRSFRGLLEPGGLGIISTPYHGYLKNLALAAANRFDRHLDPLWDGGHIKFWSRPSLSRLLKEFDFENPEFVKVGRIPPFAKSLMVSFRVPEG